MNHHSLKLVLGLALMAFVPVGLYLFVLSEPPYFNSISLKAHYLGGKLFTGSQTGSAGAVRKGRFLSKTLGQVANSPTKAGWVSREEFPGVQHTTPNGTIYMRVDGRKVRTARHPHSHHRQGKSYYFRRDISYVGQPEQALKVMAVAGYTPAENSLHLMDITDARARITPTRAIYSAASLEPAIQRAEKAGAYGLIFFRRDERYIVIHTNDFSKRHAIALILFRPGSHRHIADVDWAKLARHFPVTPAQDLPKVLPDLPKNFPVLKARVKFRHTLAARRRTAANILIGPSDPGQSNRIQSPVSWIGTFYDGPGNGRLYASVPVGQIQHNPGQIRAEAVLWQLAETLYKEPHPNRPGVAFLDSGWKNLAGLKHFLNEHRPRNLLMVRQLSSEACFITNYSPWAKDLERRSLSICPSGPVQKMIKAAGVKRYLIIDSPTGGRTQAGYYQADVLANTTGQVWYKWLEQWATK